MKEIIDNAYPTSLNWENWYTDYPFEEDYRIRVFFKENTKGFIDYGFEGDMDFIKGQIPEFVNLDMEKPTMEE